MNESTIENLDILQDMCKNIKCDCDPDVGFKCEKCFTEYAAWEAKKNLIRLKERVQELEGKLLKAQRSAEEGWDKYYGMKEKFKG